MEIVTRILKEAFTSNLQYTILMDIVIAFLFLANILLGSIIGARTDKFDIRKFFFGVMKAVAVLLIIVGVSYILNVFTLSLSEIEGISISTDVVGTVELLGILIVQGIDLAKEVVDKLKSFRELKYESYDNVTVGNDKEVYEPTDMRG